MNTNKGHLEKYRKYLLNRVTSSPPIIEYIENTLASDDEAAKHSFHKIMVHNWTESDVILFDFLSDYFQTTLIPVNYTKGDVTTFYTSSLVLILKIIKFDFMFPYCRNMFSLDILFNDKNSSDCFNSRITIEDIVTGVVSRRFNEKFDLDLSDFSNDTEFIQKKINFYKLTLLSHFKILMLRMGRDTRILNLSNNNLKQAPIEILNFFIRGELIGVNLSNNDIPSLSKLLGVSRVIELLRLEGNPLCEDIDPVTYVKRITVKFPRLIELDGIKLNQYGMLIPFVRYYLETPDRRTKMVVEKFLNLYFTHYDSTPRKRINMFYDKNATLSLTTGFPEEKALVNYTSHDSNFLDPSTKMLRTSGRKIYTSQDTVNGVLMQLPSTVHDPNTFTVDVLQHDKKCLVLIIDGIFKECDPTKGAQERFFQFRRTFVFSIYEMGNNSVYHITNEMFYINLASQEQINNSFKVPIRNMNSLSLVNPEKEETEVIYKAFSYLTRLKKSEVELRLKPVHWDIKKALKIFLEDMNANLISPDKFIDSDEDFVYSPICQMDQEEID